MRLDYDDPNPVLIVANGWQTIYHDRKLDQASHLLTSQTPLAFLLEKNVEAQRRRHDHRLSGRRPTRSC